jgi:hypothetical protein
MKRCCCCKKEKDLKYFGLLKSSKDGYRHDCKECRKEYSSKNKEKLSIAKRKHYLLNKEKYNESSKKWYVDNLEIKKEYDKLYVIRNKEKRSKTHKEWRKLNIENIRIYKKKYYHEITTKDPLKKIKILLRAMIKRSIKVKNGNLTSDILGCSYQFFKEYIESKFEPWMNWDNQGMYNGELNYGWDIDHIIPISSAMNQEEMIRLNHYTNLQPLCSKVNRDIKNNKLDFNI